MTLVSYSESESSDSEVKSSHSSAVKPSSHPTKSGFHKVVDRSNPQKIKVKLPVSSRDAGKVDGDVQEPPMKRARVGPGSFGGFNSLLPAPKRAGGAKIGTSLGAGGGLKTGLTPSFSREPVVTENAFAQEGGSEGPDNLIEGAEVSNVGPASLQEKTPADGSQEYNKPEKPKPIMFKPLSVAKKAGKKKKSTLKEEAKSEGFNSQGVDRPTELPGKSALFPVDHETNDNAQGAAVTDEYRPMLYQSSTREGSKDGILQSGSNPYETYAQEEVRVHVNPNPDLGGQSQESQSLDAIAADLNLSESAKRQLFGRNKNSSAAINIVSFDTDREYAANETLRQAGEQAQHNPVRAIAPGKHSLKQLVSAASNQKDALEEQFASGRRNKKEAGSKYGW
ncbi:MAG: hypothetical protein Q9191_002393 [Dirinaria sp. TL-2023a]